MSAFLSSKPSYSCSEKINRRCLGARPLISLYVSRCWSGISSDNAGCFVGIAYHEVNDQLSQRFVFHRWTISVIN